MELSRVKVWKNAIFVYWEQSLNINLKFHLTVMVLLFSVIDWLDTFIFIMEMMVLMLKCKSLFAMMVSHEMLSLRNDRQTKDRRGLQQLV